jgi:SanA protein
MGRYTGKNQSSKHIIIGGLASPVLFVSNLNDIMTNPKQDFKPQQPLAMKNRWLRWIMGLALLGFLGSFLFAAINYYVKSQANPYCLRHLEQVPPSEVGIVFGAGIKGDKPSKYLKDRLDAGIQLYEAQKVKKLLLSGDNGSRRYNELAVMKAYCVEHGVDSNFIFVDYAGFDTYSTLFRAKNVFKVEQAVLVTQNYHLDRAVYIGNQLGIDCIGYSATRGSYAGYRKNTIREYVASIKSFFDVMVNRTPTFLGPIIDINGPSNFSKK